jgi:hypothetical protein
MTSYAITVTAIEHYADALAQFDHLLGRLTGKRKRSGRPTVSWRPWCKRKAASCCGG